MFLLRKPSAEFIAQHLAAQTNCDFSYPEVGASRYDQAPPASYTIDHYRTKLGHGADAFEKGKAAIRNWKMFDFDWIEVYPPSAQLRVGTDVSVLAAHFANWSLNPCRIVYLVDERGSTDRYGFAYGTLPEHSEQGEERFTVEWNHADDTVSYDLYSYAKGNYLIVKLGFPVRRLMQKRFARDSQQAMVNAVKLNAAKTDAAKHK